MLFETLLQTNLLIMFLILGLLGGIIFDIGNFVKFLFANKKVACIILDIIETLLAGSLAIYGNIKLNYGLLRLFPFLIFFAAFCVQRLTIGKLVAKIYTTCYNKLIIFWQKLLRFFKNKNQKKDNLPKK